MKSDPALKWLLEEKDPPVRYWTLRDLLDVPPDHPECLATQRRIPNHAAAAEILSQRRSDGYWRRAARENLLSLNPPSVCSVKLGNPANGLL